MIKGSFPISKILDFVGNSYVCGQNEDIRIFYDCTWKRMWIKALYLFQKFYFSGVRATNVEKMKILDYFFIAHGKDCD